MPKRMRKRWWIAAVAGLATGLVVGGAVAFGQSVLDDGTPLTGPDADRARTAAVQATGGGVANSVERDNEDGAVYEVEVTRPDGTTVDVRLDGAFRVVVIESDSESADEDGADER